MKDTLKSYKIKKEWEIAAFKYRNDSDLLYKLGEDGRYRADPHHQPEGFDLDDMLAVCETIYSVRWLSTGKVFVVGEVVDGPPGFGPYYIRNFSIDNGRMTVYYENNTRQELEFLEKHTKS